MQKNVPGMFAAKVPLLLILLEMSLNHFHIDQVQRYIDAIYGDIMNVLKYRMEGVVWDRDISWEDLYLIFSEYLESPSHFREMNKLDMRYDILNGLIYW